MVSLVLSDTRAVDSAARLAWNDLRGLGCINLGRMGLALRWWNGETIQGIPVAYLEPEVFEEKSGNADRKIEVLATDPRDGITSALFEDPARKIWGGGVKVDRDTIMAASALPPEQDTAFVLKVLQLLEILEYAEIVRILEGTPYEDLKANAQKYFGMTA